MSTLLEFVVVSGPDKDKRLRIYEGTGHILGRLADCPYTLNDPRISRNHAVIDYVNGVVAVSDNGSSGGTFVNNHKIAAKQTLKPGDVIQAGESTLRLQLGSDASTLGPSIQPADYDVKATEELAELCGRKLAHFDIGPVLGKGDSALVFRATDTDDGKAVALKVMQPAFAQNEEEMQRFVRAMKSMLPLNHPHLVRLYTAGRSGPYCWVAMELVEGESLTSVIKRIGIAGMLDWKYAWRVAMQIGQALEYAHGEGIVHRNITPQNILIQSSDKSAKLGDLMLAKALEGALARQVTRPGELVGDVNYMSPERTRDAGAEADHRSDLFSLGATTYALLTGKPPFAGSTLVETIGKIRNAEPIKPTKVQMSIPTSFEGAVLKLLAKDPAGRYQSAGELISDLERIGKLNGAKL